MHYVGVDLAWGDRSPTGLAVVDDAGRLVLVEALRTDDEIVAALAPYDGEVLVAIDAPLMVTNPTGNRPAEAALNKDFARFDAGAHPSNTGKPEFSDGTRGARLCTRLRLDMNPRSGRARRAIEVYPHPATVALFRLGRTLKYKQKPGRDLDSLRAEILLLMDLVEGLADAVPAMEVTSPAWSALRQAATGAARKAALRVVEDQVDAVVAAYVAMFAELAPERTTTYGDPANGYATGYIMTPTLPSDLEPTPRPARVRVPPADVVKAAVGEYTANHQAVDDAAQGWTQLVTSVLDDAGINYLSVSGRAKTVSSFAAKAARTVDGVAAFSDPLTQITDQVGVRVITYVHSDVAAVVGLLADQVVVHDDRDMGEETAREGRWGYASRHLLVGLDAAREKQPAYAALATRQAQVQIRTVLQHAWAEFEHDIRYKGTVPDEHAPDLDRRFTLAAGLLELADREFSTIRDRLQAGMSEQAPSPPDDDPRISPRELAAFLAGQYSDAGWSRTDHYSWISGLLLELGVTSLDELAEVLRPLDSTALVHRMDYRYPPGAVRRLDDALLVAFGDRYVGLGGNADRSAALTTRLARLVEPS